MDTYRIVEATIPVYYSNNGTVGYAIKYERRFRAEIQHRLFWLFKYWFPVKNGSWVKSAAQAYSDIQDDRALRKPKNTIFVLDT